MRRLLACLALAACTGGSTGPPAPTTLTLDPPTHDFGTVDVGSSAGPVEFIVRNTGTIRTGTLLVGTSGSSAGDFTISANNCAVAGTLDPDRICTFNVALTPLSRGFKGAQIVVRADPGGTATSIANGIANNPAAVALVPSSHDFLTVAHATVPRYFTFTLTNSGDDISGPPVASVTGPDASSFIIEPGLCTAVSPFAPCGVAMDFFPLTTGVKTATLQITTTPGGTVTATLTGMGT